MNLALLAVLALALRRRARALALPAVAVGLAAIWLRGYVVPGTPRFAPRLVAALPLPYDPFDHDEYAPDPSGSGVAGGGARDTGESDLDTADTDADGAPAEREAPDAPGSLGGDLGEELVERLLEAGVLAADGEALVLDGDFDADWREEMAALAALDTVALADATFAVAHAAEVDTFENEGGEWVVLGDGSGDFEGETWLTRPVAIAETAAVRALDGRVDEGTAQAAAGPLRMFLDSCPDCGAALVESTTADCCGGGTDPRSEPDDVVACPECRTRLFTFAG